MFVDESQSLGALEDHLRRQNIGQGFPRWRKSEDLLRLCSVANHRSSISIHRKRLWRFYIALAAFFMLLSNTPASPNYAAFVQLNSTYCERYRIAGKQAKISLLGACQVSGSRGLCRAGQERRKHSNTCVNACKYWNNLSKSAKNVERFFLTAGISPHIIRIAIKRTKTTE